MVTTNMKRLGHASRVLIHRSPRNRLLADSVVMTDNLVTVIEKAIDRTWGHIDDTRLVDNALRHTLNL
jgi:mRNA-degrading endonuclease toxin of MazEF toxin-antitoxin module